MKRTIVARLLKRLSKNKKAERFNWTDGGQHRKVQVGTVSEALRSSLTR